MPDQLGEVNSPSYSPTSPSFPPTFPSLFCLLCPSQQNSGLLGGKAAGSCVVRGPGSWRKGTLL